MGLVLPSSQCKKSVSQDSCAGIVPGEVFVLRSEASLIRDISSIPPNSDRRDLVGDEEHDHVSRTNDGQRIAHPYSNSEVGAPILNLERYLLIHPANRLIDPEGTYRHRWNWSSQ